MVTKNEWIYKFDFDANAKPPRYLTREAREDLTPNDLKIVSVCCTVLNGLPGEDDRTVRDDCVDVLNRLIEEDVLLSQDIVECDDRQMVEETLVQLYS